VTFLCALRDLQWRRRRVLIAAIGAALVFSITLVLAGVSHGFDVETNRTMDKFGADGWIVGTGASGPFIGQEPILATTVAAAAKQAGVTAANPFIFSRKTMGLGTPQEVNLFGTAASGPGVPTVDKGRVPTGADEIAISSKLDHKVGDTVYVSRKPFHVVGTINNWTVIAGVPSVLVTTAAAQKLTFLGQPIISGVAVKGTPATAPPGTRFMTNEVARGDLLRAVKNARAGIDLVGLLLWIVAGTIIGSVIYLSALERMHDFAVYKATGTASHVVLIDLVTQAVILAVISAVIGVIVAKIVGPFFPIPVVIPLRSLILLPLIAVAVGLLASLAGLRRAVTVSPAVAFSSA
jgi:putative ABC transport system permease protein